ncbi:unnamed protein product [Mesocestoides corti]|uniref:Transposase n=1 Tax=Mesocestoides corti TaxID=53468 RepID=A0A0R3UJJ5_MESCO|nr:unnamed protein product [Mesocestoides corti]
MTKLDNAPSGPTMGLIKRFILNNGFGTTALALARSSVTGRGSRRGASVGSLGLTGDFSCSAILCGLGVAKAHSTVAPDRLKSLAKNPRQAHANWDMLRHHVVDRFHRKPSDSLIGQLLIIASAAQARVVELAEKRGPFYGGFRRQQ